MRVVIGASVVQLTFLLVQAIVTPLVAQQKIRCDGVTITALGESHL